MKAEIISVGTELLLGQIVDTNAAYLARRLAEVGVDVYFKQTVGDN
ncbi:MAG: molybdopterin-binding protein, partial [bacterium]